MSLHLRIVWLLVCSSTLMPVLCTQPSKSNETAKPAEKLPGTKLLKAEGDIADQMVAGMHKFLDRQTQKTAEERHDRWAKELASSETRDEFLNEKRSQLVAMLGVHGYFDPQTQRLHPQAKVPRRATRTVLEENWRGYRIELLRIPTLLHPQSKIDMPLVHTDAVYINRLDKAALLRAVFVPDFFDRDYRDATFGANGQHTRAMTPFRLADQGYHVLVPLLTSYFGATLEHHRIHSPRELIYRSSFELGKHPIGYDVDKLLTCSGWLKANIGCRAPTVNYFGFGTGGHLAMCAAALDSRGNLGYLAHHFDQREQLWQEPIDRNVFGFLQEFGDAELICLAGPGAVIIDTTDGRNYTLGSQAQQLKRACDPETRTAEFQRLRELAKVVDPKWAESLRNFPEDNDAEMQKYRNTFFSDSVDKTDQGNLSRGPSSTAAWQRQIETVLEKQPFNAELIANNEAILAESPYVRKQRFWDKLDTSSVTAFEKSVAPFREEFRDEVIGRFDIEPLPFDARTRLIYDKEKWTGYEVMLDVFPDVFAYGILCVPKDLARDGSERRPVVVCQHGLEGRPADCIVGDHRAYHNFAARLCERGFVVFCPQNPYIGGHKFRTLQRKANPIGKTLFSIITPQHQQICDWLQTQPFVDGERIGFYGLSYGGKTAMRVPPLVDDYKCVICSADFNDWVWKCASTRSPYSYVFTGEYEIWEWDLAHRFNYAEMAALIAPRPFMVERGHFDGVAPDERVASEFAKVRLLYQGRLKLPADKCQIEWFDGPHTINGKGTFAFLHHHLNWPEPE